MLAAIICMYVLSAVLPAMGFGRLLIRAQRNVVRQKARVAQRGHPHLTWDEFDELGSRFSEQVFRERNDLIWDVILVGVGLATGAGASIWALFM